MPADTLPVDRGKGDAAPVAFQYVYFIRHSESRWNRAQADSNLYGMWSENDHGLSERGRVQSEDLRSSLAEVHKQMSTSPVDRSSPQVRRWDWEYMDKLVAPDAVYCSPFTRAIQTAVIGLKDVLARTGKLTILPEVREQRNSLFSMDTSGIAVGDEIRARLEDEMTELYNQAEDPVKYSANGLRALKLNCTKAQEQWWNDSAEPEEEVRSRQQSLISMLRSQGAGSSTIVVGHSHYFRRFFQEHMTRTAMAAHPEIVASLQVHVIPPCGVIGMKLAFPADGANGDARDASDDDDIGASVVNSGCILEAVPLLGTSLPPAESGHSFGMRFLPSCATRQCSGYCGGGVAGAGVGLGISVPGGDADDVGKV